MNITLPPQDDDVDRHYYSNDGTPLIIDFQEIDGEEVPVGAQRLTTRDGGFIWHSLDMEDELDQDFFISTFGKDGTEVDLEEFQSRVVRDFVDIRSSRFDAEDLSA